MQKNTNAVIPFDSKWRFGHFRTISLSKKTRKAEGSVTGINRTRTITHFNVL